MNLHVEPARSARDDAPDPTHAQDAESLAGDLRAHHERRAPVLPQALAHKLFPFTCAARGADHQHHGEFGRRVRQHIRRVGHDDPSCARGFQVDMVVADGEVGDDPDLGGQTLENVGGEMLRVAWQDGLRAPGVFDELVTRVEAVVGIQAGLVVALQAIFHGDGKLACDEVQWVSGSCSSLRFDPLIEFGRQLGDSLRDFVRGLGTETNGAT